MPDIPLESVFKAAGVPTVTYVEPYEYGQLLANLRIPGRGLIVEGPSGIGKTTAMKKSIAKSRYGDNYLFLSARKPDDVAKISLLPTGTQTGLIVIDDFHRLDSGNRHKLADYMKHLADIEDEEHKIVIVGINKAGHGLLALAGDLVARIDTVHFDANPAEKVAEVIQRGLDALNVEWNITNDISRGVMGSFQLAQLACYEILTTLGVPGWFGHRRKFSDLSFETHKARLWNRLDALFRARTETFCRGPSLKKSGRAPYLQLLRWLSACPDGTLEVRREIERNSHLRSSVATIIDRGHVKSLIDSNEDIQAALYYDVHAEHLTVEDPRYLFYLANIPWNRFSKEVGFAGFTFKRKYDFALSFAGADRSIAKQVFERLSSEQMEVFYDHNESYRILAQDVEDYLGPIYQSEAHFIVVFLSRNYPQRIWTKFESDAFRNRVSGGGVIPVWLDDAVDFPFSDANRLGSYRIDQKLPLARQIEGFCAALRRKIIMERQKESELLDQPSNKC